MVNLIKSYLSNRNFFTTIDNEHSKARPIQAGVPQGSVIGPYLYNIYTSDLNNLKRSEIAQFADDTAIYASERRKKSLHKYLQEDINIITNYYKTWRIKLNETKTQAVYYHPKTIHKKLEDLNINNHKISWTYEAKYLGVTLDQNLKYKTHITNLSKKIGQLTGALYPLLNANSKLSLENKVHLIKTILIPAATYAGEIWHQADTNHINSVQIKINKATRLAANAPRFMTNSRLFQELDLDTIETTVLRKTQNTIANIHSHTNPLIRNSLDLNRRVIKKEGINALKRKADELQTLMHTAKKRKSNSH